MKRFLPLLAILAAPHFAFAQTMAEPVPLPANPTATTTAADELPDADELLDHLFDVYEAARTFSGRFDISLQGHDPKQPPPFSAISIKTLVRFNSKGDKEREASAVAIAGAFKGQKQTLNYVDDGQSQNTVFIEQKAWQPSQRGQMPDLRDLLKPVLQQVAKELSENPTVSLSVSQGVDAGRAVYVLRDDSSSFRAVVDVQTHALRSLEMLGDITRVSIRGSEQTFNAPISDSNFKWTPPKGFRRAEEGSLALPSFLNSATTAPIPKPAPVKPAPLKPTSPKSAHPK